MNKLIDQFTRARAAGTPLLAISSFDPEATMASIQSTISGATDEKGSDDSAMARGKSTIPIVQWDCVNGWQSRNKAGKTAVDDIVDDPMQTVNPTACLEFALKLPAPSIIFLLNAHHYLSKPEFCQALWNLRDEFKADMRSVVLLGPEFTLPAQLMQDILLLDEPLPSDVELRKIVTDIMTEVEIPISKEQTNAAVDALRGLSAFPAEQSVAMSVGKAGLDIDALWDRKRKLISSTPGLRVYTGKEKFVDIGGCDQVKRFFNGVIEGKESPNVIVFIDEGEKMFGGSSGDVQDSSGVSQDFLGTTLSYMEDNECDGAIFVGPPGAAKSAIAKASGNEAGIPTIVMDLGGMKGSLVGQSETQLRNALKVITAVGGGRAYFVMTCNKIASLPPELRRRFTSGVFFFDLPTQPEREKIWKIYLDKYGIKDVPVNAIEFDEGWTGAEIRNCCRMAYRQSITISDAADYIVPVSKSAAQQLDGLRKQASGAYLSANSKGIYEYIPDRSSGSSQDEPKKVKRQINIG